VAREDALRIKVNIGRRVAELRRKVPATQEGLAELLDVSVQWLSRVEAGSENLTIETLAKLANSLGVRVVDLFRAPGPEPKGPKRGRPRGR
jgi:transcriptional regulator with XRE-family HTH domain